MQHSVVVDSNGLAPKSAVLGKIYFVANEPRVTDSPTNHTRIQKSRLDSLDKTIVGTDTLIT